MNRVKALRAPALFAIRRMRTRPVSLAALAAALASAGALIGWSSLEAALSQEKSVRLELRSLPPKYRSFRVLYYTLPLEADFRAVPVQDSFRGFAPVTAPVRRVTVWHSIERNNPLGTRLVVTSEPGNDVVVDSGRLPSGCRGRVCEAMSLRGSQRLGERLPLGKRRFALIVGRGSLRPQVLPDRSELGKKALLVQTLAPPLQPLVKEHGSTVIYSAALDPAKVHGFELASLGERLRRAIIRLERGDNLVRATAPLAVIDSLARRGRVARERLLLVAGQAAALVLAFAAFVASSRRRETELVDDQLKTLGASNGQAWAARLVEALVPSVAGAALALAGLLIAAISIAMERGLPFSFVGGALPLQTVLAIVAAGVAGFVLLLLSVAPIRRSRFGVGTLELAAVTALAVVVWQAWTTGALDPEHLAAGGSPVILILPALAFFAAGVLLLRLLPLAVRTSERLARRSAFGIRLAFLTTARSPAQTATATTFLAVALGSALFSLNYRATLDQQARDQARFTAGASWRVTERGRARQPDVTPLTRYVRATNERPTPVLRLAGEVIKAYPQGAQLPVTVLAVPAARMREMLGWRQGFSDLSLPEIARRLRPQPVRLAGPQIAKDTQALGVWARSTTDFPRLVILHLLLPGQGFAHVRLGAVWRQWRWLEVTLPRSLRGAELIGIEYAPTVVPTDFKYDPQGFIDLGRIEQRRGDTWSSLPPLANWTQAKSPDETAGVLTAWRYEHAPIAHGIRFDLYGTFRPLIHPTFGLPAPEPGFESGTVPVLASDPVAEQAVDGLVTLDVPGKQLPARVVATARLFPTIADRPSSFVVLDYDTLFAVLNADQPGLALPSEAWFFRPQTGGFGTRLTQAPFRLKDAVNARQLEGKLLTDPLAAGTRSMLGIAAVVAALIGLVGLILAARSGLAAERLQLAEYEALGVARSSLRRGAQLRIFALSVLGVAAGLLGALVSVRLIGAFVAVTGTAKQPLPPIVAVVAWPIAAIVVGAVAIAAGAAAAIVAGRALRETTARRLRA